MEKEGKIAEAVYDKRLSLVETAMRQSRQTTKVTSEKGAQLQEGNESAS